MINLYVHLLHVYAMLVKQVPCTSMNHYVSNRYTVVNVCGGGLTGVLYIGVGGGLSVTKLIRQVYYIWLHSLSKIISIWASVPIKEDNKNLLHKVNFR